MGKLTEIPDFSVSLEQGTRYFNRFIKVKSTHFMSTPCSHCFHVECLIAWMKVRMQCPNCRADLPPIR